MLLMPSRPFVYAGTDIWHCTAIAHFSVFASITTQSISTERVGVMHLDTSATHPVTRRPHWP
ncbi:hypothetical protein HaLaN_19398 [Haematococcus lacustris]|uniref:Uncharacterized protein n=1 Tax=Haematococcus lacustris TaxID=44745 RepID=A0A699ZIA6_HAELA|nr:hypothetical protein HaLaN_19398 [Haematococcus lacustris]